MHSQFTENEYPFVSAKLPYSLIWISLFLPAYITENVNFSLLLLLTELIKECPQII